MKLEGLGRVEQIVTDDQDRPRSMTVSAVVAGTPVVITLDAGPGTCFVEAQEEDRNVFVEVAQ